MTTAGKRTMVVLGLAALGFGAGFLLMKKAEGDLASSKKAAPAANQADGSGKADSPEPSMRPPVEGRYSSAVKSNLLQKLSRPMFKEVAGELGIDFKHSTNPALRPVRATLEIPMDIAGGGVSAGDYNGDGYPDLFFAGYGGGRLYRNDRGTRFVDATSEAGLALQGESRAAYFIDYDNDGDLDLFITWAGAGIRLFENTGAGHFVEATHRVGLDIHQDITHEAVFADLDNDGWIDIYTATFGRWDQGKEPILHRQNDNGEPNRLYHHRVEGGRHFFEEIGAKAWVDDPGWTHCVGAWDLDQDGKIDLFSFNDFGPAHAYHNLGNCQFREWSAAVRMQEAYNGMGFALMDLNGDGRFEAYVTEISIPVVSGGNQVRYRMPDDAGVLPDKTLEFLARTVNNRLYSDMGNGRLENRHHALFEPAETGWSWDGSPIDFDNDGDLDFLLLNGTENYPPTLPDETRPRHLAQRAFIQRYANDSNFFFVNEGAFLYNMSGVCELAYKGNSRASAFLDFDLDGDLDVAINDYEGQAKLFRNLQTTGNHWVRLHLQGTRSNRNALGARVSVEDSEGGRHHAVVVSGTGFLSQDPLDLHFGLGKAKKVRRVSIHWPSGRDQSVENLEVDRLYPIEETP